VAAGTGFGLLGPLLVRRAGVVTTIPSGRQRALLAALLLNANRAVPVEELALVLWGAGPPPSARVTIQNYVKRLRNALKVDGDARIVTVAGGYLIRVEAGELDVSRFEVAQDRARDAGRHGAWELAAAELRAALALWRGEPLADVPSQRLALRQVPRLAELRMQAVEARVEADLHLGRHGQVIPELLRLADAHPLRERLAALLMLALYHNGQQGEALAAYQRTRRVLIEELGNEPGPELRQLQQQILASDPALAGPESLPVAPPAAGHVVPRELPAPVRHFTGRAAELDELDELSDLAAGGGGGPTLVICAVGGTAGVGKTALAVQWAHQVAGRFPDGQLYVNLRGYDPGEPVLAADALAGFLRSLGVPGTDVPDGAEDRTRLYRSKLAGRWMLVLLDNARDGDQVRPLLPGDPGCIAVVTSRDALAGLVATDGARRLDLDVLPPADAVALLRSLIGGRVDADPEAVAALAGLCARLPLALRIAAELAATRRTTPLADLVAELERSQLDCLDAGEDRADVRAVFSWSYRQLPDDAATAFALIGLHPGTDLDVHAAAALTGVSTGQARSVLGRLHRASLLQAAGPGRYGMHDLLRAYAREQAAARDTGGCCRQALTQLFDYYRATAGAAMDTLAPAEAHLRPRIPPSATTGPTMAGDGEARAWLDRERANLAAVVAHCAGHGWPRHATDLAVTLFRYLMTGSHLPEALTIYGHALEAARRSGDLAAEADALNGLGGIGLMRGHFRDAAGYYRPALERYRRCGDRKGEARVLQNLGQTEYRLHNLRSAAGSYRRAIAAFEDAGDRLGTARALAFLGGVEAELGSYDQAEGHLQRALPVLRDAEDQLYEAGALWRIGELNLGRGELAQAAAFFEQAMTIDRRIDNPNGVAAELCSLGEVSVRQGEYQQATSYLRQALGLYREVGDQHGEARTLITLAEALHGAAQPAAARAELETALRLAAETGNTYQQARAHRDLADSHHRADHHEEARCHWRQALDLYTQLGAPEADQVQSRLSAGEAKAPQ
jgi:DNA-binding SARP family transcriptional activator/tetratricopeptide (TPR) repeat protein